MFFVFLKRLGRALWRGICAIGRFFKFLFKKFARNSRTNKLKKKIKNNEAAITKLYTAIGESYFVAHETDAEPGLSELCGSVAADLAENDVYREDIDSILTDYANAKAEAKRKAASKRESDKKKAKIDKARAESKKSGAEYIEPEDDIVDGTADETADGTAYQEIQGSAVSAEEAAPEIIPAPLPVQPESVTPAEEETPGGFYPESAEISSVSEPAAGEDVSEEPFAEERPDTQEQAE